MKNTYLVWKVDKENVQIIIDGLPKTLSRKYKEADSVIQLAKNFNKFSKWHLKRCHFSFYSFTSALFEHCGALQTISKGVLIRLP